MKTKTEQLNAKKEIKFSGALLDFSTEYYNAADHLKETLSLPFENFKIEYNKRHEMLYVKNKSVKIKITEAASGLQSAIPLCLVSHYLSKLIQSSKKSVDGITGKFDMSNKRIKRATMIYEIITTVHKIFITMNLVTNF